MSVANVRFFSEALGKWTPYILILPGNGNGPFPVLMQLHGLSDDCYSWIHLSNLARYVEQYEMVVVLPDGGTSAYLNWKASNRLNKLRYEDLLMRDIPAHVKRHVNIADGPWAIGGLSMGGYGAIRLGMKYPDRFASIYGHSSALVLGEYLDPNMIENAEDADPYRHADALAAREQQPVISFDCGVNDDLVDSNRLFHAHLDQLGIAHHYAEFEGGHEWDYWDLHVQEALKQHADVFSRSATRRKSAPRGGAGRVSAPHGHTPF